MWDDLSRAEDLCKPDIVLAVNDISVDYPHDLDYMVSYHSDLLIRWDRLRRERGLGKAKQVWTGKALNRNPLPNIKQHDSRGGSSGLLATQIALDDAKATHVMLIGIPMSPDMRHYHDGKRGEAWSDGRHYKGHWESRAPYFAGRVRSFSGWTCKLLGEPTIEWLEDIPDV